MTKSPIPNWLAQLLRRFSPRLLRLGADGLQALPGGGNGEPLTLVGRELCLFLRVDAPRVPARQRGAFIAMAVRRAAPFADPEFDVLWSGDHAAVWYWSRERARALGSASPRRRAEAMFRGDVPTTDLTELLDLSLDLADGESLAPGVEARVWRAGQLQASRWWPQVPDAAAWTAFARGAGLDAGIGPPPATPARLREQPMDRGGRQRLMAPALGAPASLLAGVAATLVLALLAWQCAGIARPAWRHHLLEREIQRMESGMNRILEAREQADAARARIDRMLALRPAATQTRLMGEIARITPGDWELMLWNQPAPGLLEATFRMSDPDVAALVSAWEASPLLQEVAPVSGAGLGDVTLRATLTPIAEQSP